jgi:hypothetical protein
MVLCTQLTYFCPQGVVQSVGDHASLSGGYKFESPFSSCVDMSKNKIK